MATPKRETIVAEVTKNWKLNPDPEDLLSSRFEHVIAENARRGYRLDDWRLSQVSYPDEDGTPIITETIIAVFKLGINE